MYTRSFRTLPLTQRVELLRDRGTYIGSRIHGGHQVHLYQLAGFHVELWMRLGLREVEWAEVVHNTDILSEYVKLDPKDLL
ncbi:MAG: hypothetical protein KDC00_11920 [Flavobacteriales bacterium]|nr:hypothetical protein [Flavobacteriales bacterium]